MIYGNNLKKSQKQLLNTIVTSAIVESYQDIVSTRKIWEIESERIWKIES